MKTLKAILLSAGILLATSVSDYALAHRGSGTRAARFTPSARPAPKVRPAPSAPSVRPPHPNPFLRPGAPGSPPRFFHAPRAGVFFLGAPVFAPLYYPPSGYYYDPSLPAPPAVYIEQEPAPAEPVPEPSYWYYCPDTQTYYPYVDSCESGWQQVIPETTPPS